MRGMILGLALMVLGGVARGEVIYSLKDAYDTNPTSPVVKSYSSIGNYQSNTAASTWTRSAGSQGPSGDSAILSNGSYYFLDTSSSKIWNWSSLSDWAIDSGASNVGTRTGAGANYSYGFSVTNAGEIYFLLKESGTGYNARLTKWNSISDWSNASNSGTSLGTTFVDQGVGFEITEDGRVWKLGYTSASDTTGTLRVWDSVSAFLANGQGGAGYGWVGGPNGSLAVVSVPEPGTLLLGSIAAACGGGGVWWRRKRKAAPVADEAVASE